MYPITEKNTLRDLLSQNKKALTFCHDSARFDLEKPFHVLAIPARNFTEKKIAEYVYAIADLHDMTDYSGVIFFERVRFSYRDLMAIHYSGMRFDGIMNSVFPFHHHEKGIDTFWGKTDLETARKAFRKMDGKFFYIVAQQRNFLRPSDELSRNAYHAPTPIWRSTFWRKACEIVKGQETDKCGNNRVYRLMGLLEQAQALREERARKAASEMDTTHFRAEMEHTIRECREMVADYILNYTHDSFETIPGALHTLNVLYEMFCNRDRKNAFASPDLKRRNMDEIRKCADRVKALYAEWKEEQKQTA